MHTQTRFLSYLRSTIITLGLLFSLFITPNKAYAEGSVDFIDYPGFRLFYFAERPQQLKVYASAGEFINFGASHVGISSGFIELYRPDGTLHSTYNNTGSNAGLGIINNNIEEANGPTGGGTTQGAGYTPGIVEVDNGEEGVWTIVLGYGFYQNSGFDNLMNNEPWTREEDQPTNRRVVLSWDITVSQNAAANDGGNMLTGRVYTNEYQSIVSENGNTTSPTFYLLTDEGFQFQIDYQDVDPWGFQIVSNNMGIITGDTEATYSSFEQDEVERSADISSFDPANFYLYEPQARDINGLINNKVFFNIPDPNMPASATVTDIIRDDTHTTWLLSELPDLELQILNVNFFAKEANNAQGIEAVLDRTNGAVVTYETNVSGTAQLVIDLNSNGIYGDEEDRVVNANSNVGVNEITWDGLDRNGQELDQQFNRTLSYRLTINAGELHLTLSDIENDLGGVSLTRLNGDSPSDQFLYDHSRLGEAISGGNVLPLPTSEPFTFDNNFGDLKMLDYWTYVASVSADSELVIDIVDDISLLAPDTDGDGVRDDSDLDDDNDGILDELEYCGNQYTTCFSTSFNLDYDEDFDGIPNYADADDSAFDLGCEDVDGDGRCDRLPQNLDQDNDGVPNFIDLDADNDGIFDVAETLLSDADNDGFLYEGTPIVDDFGRVLLTSSSQANYISETANNDADLVPNFLDLDSDNDGIHDIIESGHEDPDDDGVLSFPGTQEVTMLGLIINIPGQEVISITKDHDGDSLPDYLDLDADNDGINDIVEGGNIDADNDGQLEGDFNLNGQAVLNNEILSTSFPTDQDGDGIPNYNDLDSDNDGINDVLEGGNVDPDNDGRVGTGIANIAPDGRVVMDGDTIASTSFPLDTDQDGIFDYEDIDSDGDGIFDVYEANLPDEDNDGMVGSGNLEVDDNGIVLINGQTGNTSNPIDTDGDGAPDFRDLDSDNDSISDNEECAAGAPCPDVDQSGVPDFLEFTPLVCPIPLVQPTVDFPSSICDNETLSLTVNESAIYESAYPNETITYIWTNNNGVQIGTTTNSVFDIPANDPLLVLPLTVMVSVDVDCESENSDPVSLDINPTPNPMPSAAFESICVGGGVELFAESIPGATYQWFFSTFPFSNIQNPLVQTLNQSTTFGVVATLNGCESERQDVFIVVDEPPVIQAVLGDGIYCTGEDVFFTAVNNNPDLAGDLNYIFSGPNGLLVDVLVPANGQFEFTLPAVDFVNSGQYSLVVDDGSGCVSNTENYTVDITEGPDQPVITAIDNSVCLGEMITLTTQTYTGPNVTYTWIFDGVDIDVSATPEFDIINATNASGGNYSVRVDTGEDCGPSTSAPVSISVVDTSVSPEIENDLISTTACEGQTVNLRIANPTPETIYTWRNPSGAIIATDVLDVDITNIQMSDQGVYTVEANIDGCAILTDQETIEVSEGLETPTVDDVNIQACEGQNVDIVINNYSFSPNTIFSLFSSDGTLLIQSPEPIFELGSVTSNSNTNYFATVEQGDCSSPMSTEITLTIITPPNELANAGVDASFCASENINLNATMPTVGTGTWSSTTATIADANNPNTSVSNLQVGTNMFIWELSANGCSAYSRDTVFINVNDVPNETAVIQNSTTEFCESSLNNFTLFADGIFQSMGQWTVANGPSSLVFNDPNSNITSATGFVPGTYTLAWTLSTADCGIFSADEINITISEQPAEIADAGNDAVICGSEVTLSATPPSQGQGVWTSTSGVILDPTNPNTIVNNLPLGNHTFTWTLSSGTCTNYSFDEVVIESSGSPSEIAGVVNDRINICEGSSLSLEAIMPVQSQGVWVQNSGPNATIANPNQIVTNVNYSVAGTYVFFWELSTQDCDVFSVAGIEVVVDPLPSELANAGVDTNICGTQLTLNANAPQDGTGMWTSTSGIIADPSDPNTMVTDLSAGTHVFTWELSSGVCENYSSDQVTITSSSTPNETAQVVNNDMRLCENDINGSINIVAIDPLISTGRWEQVSGPNSSVITNDGNAIASVSGLVPGVYQFVWILSTDNCSDFSQDVLTISVDELPTNIFAEAGTDQSLCAIETTTLNANMPAIGSGTWSIINTPGASVVDIMDPNTTVQLVEGENIFVWSLSNGGCENYATDTVRVFLSTPEDEADIITQSLDICENAATSITLEAAAINSATGLWTQTAGPGNANINNATSTQVDITNLSPGNYSFQWTLSVDNCNDYASDVVNVNISELPNEEANVAQDEVIVCDDNSVSIEAMNPTVGTGVWTSSNNATIVSENNSTTTVNNLQAGQNTFTWTLSNGACVDYSQAEINVFVEDGVEAVGDNYSTAFATTIQSENLVNNDILNGNSDWTIELVGSASEITINTDGTFSFVPANGFSGEYTFEYDLCDTSCGICERAVVRIVVDEAVEFECDIPNVLTPNNDNKNDALVIDCANQFENNVIQIFNRWGDKVHEKETYQNDWRGTFKGDDLPAGTYFYVFKKDRNESEAITGFITILR